MSAGFSLQQHYSFMPQFSTSIICVLMTSVLQQVK